MAKAAKKGVLTRAVYHTASGIKMELAGEFNLAGALEHIALGIALDDMPAAIERLQKSYAERLATKNDKE